MTVITYDVVRERVARGAALLDEKSPGWWRTLVPESIDVRYGDRCVLGSLNPVLNYYSMLKQLEIEEESDDDGENAAAWYGFNVAGDAEDENESYARLTDTWRNLIAERQIEAGLR